MEGDNFLLFHLPVEDNTNHESLDRGARLAGTVVPSVIAVDHEEEAVGELDGFKLGCIVVDT